VLFLLATQVLQDTRRGWLLALLLCAIPAIHWLLYPPGALRLEGDLALLAALALVGATAGVAGAPDRTYKILFALAGASDLAMMLVTRNRGALLALAAGLLVLWLTSRYKGRALAGFAVVLVAVVLLANPKAYWERFSALWNPQASHATASLDRDTAQQRLSLWQAGKQMVKDAPWLGVGPGNFPNAVAFYEPSAAGLPAHNSIVSIATETGVPGLLLYLALVSSAVIALVRAIRGGRAQERAMRSLLLAAILAFFTGSMVLTRHDTPLFYLLLGWAVAATQPSARGRRDSPPAP
jgi:O-antigen ligase